MFCPDFSSYPILVIGDVMLDIYYWGEVARISPEAPVPIVCITDKTHTLGGAANVALNLAKLGCPVTLIGLSGKDAPAEILSELLKKSDIKNQLIADSTRTTTTKTRILSGNQQIVRLDEEKTHPPQEVVIKKVLANFQKAAAKAKAVIVSDYGKGLLSSKLCRNIISYCRKNQLPVFVDPKGDDWSRYRGATCITPNNKEFNEVSRQTLDSGSKVPKCVQELIDDLSLSWLLITRGKHGISLFNNSQKALHIPTEAREVYDVSGAGDTVIATAAAGFAAKLSMAEAVSLANCAAGIVVQKVGTCPITRVELELALRNRELSGTSKLFSIAEAKSQIASWKAENKITVFTNGCFDLLHTGHIKLLHAAASEGSKLIVGLNSDCSVRRLKGPERPVLPEQERAALLGAIGCVDMVIIFSEDTPLKLISAIKPNVLVKGGDYRPETVVGKEQVESYGGKVVIVPLKQGVSTTNIIDAVNQKRNIESGA